MSKSGLSKYTFISEYENNNQIQKYPCSSLALFTLSLYLQIDDIDEFATKFITEGPEDKKVDICYWDEESHHLIIVQDYIAKQWGKKSAPENKANDLNTAISWLFCMEIENVPLDLRPKAIEIRKAIENSDIDLIEIFFIHNCTESTNVDLALQSVKNLTHNTLIALSPNNYHNIKVWHREIGLNIIEEFYKSRDSQILIDETIDVPLDNNFLIQNTDKWNAVLTTVSANWIRSLYNKYGNRLFSANYREYLGHTKKEDNINRKITETANSQPDNFWVFNNGITALTKKIIFKNRWKKIQGISIINGAQTSGALGLVNEDSAKQAKVLIRFVECSELDVVDNIIQYNNTQNDIKPEDIRSKDQIQTRIYNDFNKYNFDYYYRRSDRKPNKTSISVKSVAVCLCAFHGYPQIAFRNPKKIFKDDEIYRNLFNKNIQVEHIFLVRSLSLSIDAIKNELKNNRINDVAREIENKQDQFLKYSASKHFLIYIVGFLIEEILGKRVSNKYNCKCKPEMITQDNHSLLDSWKIAIGTILPFVVSTIEKIGGQNAFYDVPRSDTQSREVADNLKIHISSLEYSLKTQFLDLRNKIQ